jgi:hypothetical protein
VSLEMTAARPVGMCACSPPLVVWDADAPGRNVHGGGDWSERCGACRKPREVIRVVYYETLPEHAAVGGST